MPLALTWFALGGMLLKYLGSLVCLVGRDGVGGGGGGCIEEGSTLWVRVYIHIIFLDIHVMSAYRYHLFIFLPDTRIDIHEQGEGGGVCAADARQK